MSVVTVDDVSTASMWWFSQFERYIFIKSDKLCIVNVIIIIIAIIIYYNINYFFHLTGAIVHRSLLLEHKYHFVGI